MGPSFVLSQLLIVGAITLTASAQRISTCPTIETNYTSTDGAIWAICSGTDYQGASVQILDNIDSNTACAQLCAQTAPCQKAVYDKPRFVCHLKTTTDSLAWVSDTVFDSVRFVSKAAAPDDPAQGITACPSQETNFTSPDGGIFAICSGTDYQGESAQILDDIRSNTACASICAQSPPCQTAVYDKARSVCHLKSSTATLIWARDAAFDSARFISKAPPLSPAKGGKWAPAVKLPVVAAGAFVVPEQPISNRILSYSSWGTYEFSGPTGMTQFADYNWQSGAVSQRTVTNTKHDMFCPGMSYLADGRIVVTGGSNAEAVSLYNYATNSWTRAADMKIPRGYQSSTTLSDGRIFTIGGSFTGGIGDQDVPFKNGEVYDPAKNTWTVLGNTDVRQMLTTYDAEGKWRTDNHAWLFGWKNGYVFQAGPSRTMHWYGTSGTGSVRAAGTRDANSDAMCGVFVMYDAVAGKIFSAGGSQSYTNSPGLTTAKLITISNPNSNAQVEDLAPMNFQRGFANAVVLPNGQVIVTGGQARSMVFTDLQSVYAAELWDPTTKTFTVLASAAVPRNYHAVSLLLADGTVWAAGGGLCPVGQGQSTDFCDKSVNHFDGEIFSPPYLFNRDGSTATRPSISSLKSNTDSRGYKVRLGGSLTVTMSDAAAGTTFSLVKLGSATHSVNTDQRRVPLSRVSQSSNRYSITLPTDAGILIPGYYYLFAMNKAGTPCVARTVQVTT